MTNTISLFAVAIHSGGPSSRYDLPETLLTAYNVAYAGAVVENIHTGERHTVIGFLPASVNGIAGPHRGRIRVTGSPTSDSPTDYRKVL